MGDIRHVISIIYFKVLLVSYKIGNKISSIITDNASNMIKAFSLLGYINTHQESDDNDDNREHILDYEDDVLNLLATSSNS